jgi:hypothetical protein
MSIPTRSSSSSEREAHDAAGMDEVAARQAAPGGSRSSATARLATRCREVDGLTAPATAAQQLGDAVAQSGLGGGSDAEVGLWTRLVIAPLVLDQPIVLGCRVLEHPEGITRRAHP